MDYYAIGQRIRRFRKAHDMAQEDLAEKIGISTTHMSHIETGNTKLSLPVLVALASALGVRTDDLLFDDPSASVNATNTEIAQMLAACTPQELSFIRDLIHTAQVSIHKYLY